MHWSLLYPLNKKQIINNSKKMSFNIIENNIIFQITLMVVLKASLISQRHEKNFIKKQLLTTNFACISKLLQCILKYSAILNKCKSKTYSPDKSGVCLSLKKILNTTYGKSYFDKQKLFSCWISTNLSGKVLQNISTGQILIANKHHLQGCMGR